MKRPGVLDAVSFSMMFHAADYGVQWAGCDVIAAVANVAADLDLRLVRALRARGPVVDVAAAAEKEAEEMMSDDVDSLASSRPPSAIRPQTLHEQVAACVAQVIAIDLDGDGSVAADEVNTIGHALSNGLANHPKYLCLIFAACAAVSAVLTVPRLPALELPVAEEVAQRTGRARASAAAFAPPFGSDDEKCRRYAVPTPLDKMHPLCRAGWAFDIADTRGSLAAAAAAHAGHSGITSACEAAVGLVTAASTVVMRSGRHFAQFMLSSTDVMLGVIRPEYRSSQPQSFAEAILAESNEPYRTEGHWFYHAKSGNRFPDDRWGDTLLL
jgi:hypothetical protein